MKLSRWIITSMVCSSLIVVLTLVTSLWLTMPKRTADAFMELMANGRIEDAERQYGLDQTFGAFVASDPRFDWGNSEIEFYPRTLVDLVCGRQLIEVQRSNPESDNGLDLMGVQFIIERGRVQRANSRWIDRRDKASNETLPEEWAKLREK